LRAGARFWVFVGGSLGKVLMSMGSAEQLYPQTLDEYYAACEEEQPWKVAL
jgi:hypothetical protein